MSTRPIGEDETGECYIELCIIKLTYFVPLFDIHNAIVPLQFQIIKPNNPDRQ